MTAPDTKNQKTPPTSSPGNRTWAVVIILLVVVIVVSSAIALAKYRPARPVEISIPAAPAYQGTVSISGAVKNPGIYPYHSEDTVGVLIQTAGGVTANADPSHLDLTVPETGTPGTPQKININRAEAWLLEALPGIGPTKAKAIVAYREKNGYYRVTTDLMKVEGIGATLYEQIKDLVTVSD